MKSRILVCGGRDFFDGVQLKVVLDNNRKYFDKDFCIIHGGARGADSLAGEWAKENGIPEIIMPASWGFHGKRAGTLRNKWMIDYCKPDLVIAFKGGVGTSRMVQFAKESNIDVYEVKF